MCSRMKESGLTRCVYQRRFPASDALPRPQQSTLPPPKDSLFALESLRRYLSHQFLIFFHRALIPYTAFPHITLPVYMTINMAPWIHRSLGEEVASLRLVTGTEIVQSAARTSRSYEEPTGRNMCTPLGRALKSAILLPVRRSLFGNR